MSLTNVMSVLLADMARLYAVDADERGSAGTSCERIYDELTIGELP